MISFLPTQCMIFSTRFVVQSVKDFHPCKCKPIRKTAISHAKQKRQGFHPYRLTFIFSQRRRHGYHMAFSLPESVHRIAPPVQTILTSQTYPESCYISCKTKAAGFPPYRLMFIFSNADETASTRRFLYPNLCVESLCQCELIPIMQFYPKSCYIHEKQSGTVFTHTA